MISSSVRRKGRWPVIGSITDIASTFLLLKTLTLVMGVSVLALLALFVGFDREEKYCGSRLSEVSIDQATAALIESGVDQSSFSLQWISADSQVNQSTPNSNGCLLLYRHGLGFRSLLENSPQLVAQIAYDSLAYSVSVPDVFVATEFWIPSFALFLVILIRWRLLGVSLFPVRQPGLKMVLISACLGASFSFVAVSAFQPFATAFTNIADLQMSRVGSIPIIVGMIFISPILEELLFRELLLRKAMENGRPLVAAMVVSLLFSLLHFTFGTPFALTTVTLASAFFFSLLLCFIYYKTGSYVACVVAHSAGNAGLLVQAVLV